MIVGILGGTFDPPHIGHLGAARAARDSTLVEEVWLVPCVRHAFGKVPATFEHRMTMCALLVAGHEGIEVSDAEARLAEPGKTLELILGLKREDPDQIYRLIAGADIYHQRHLWHRYDEVAKLAPPIYVGREGVDPIDQPTLPAPPGVSSSQIREQLERREQPAHGIPVSILDYIEKHRLYGWSQ
ncbi:MAG: nicotinate-nicotinamide nucleotide adenylyltransferase [Deltaproteobacteria bacterium]|nr:nicotinate-nicotinamide nucleotide adenylyltransferase [Deltaproteobacteria bacterium]